MQFLSVAFLLAAAQATVYNVTLGSISRIAEVNGLPITPIHEGSYMSNLFLYTHAETLLYDDQELLLGFPVGESFQGFSIHDNAAVINGFDIQKVSFDDDDFMVYNGTSEHFFACKNITNDRNLISQTNFAVTFYKDEAPKDCKPIKVKKYTTCKH